MQNFLGKPGWVRILAVFAHPDDEVFCTGGTLAHYAASDAEIMVVSATRGEAGQIRDAKLATRRTLGQVRAQELQRSCAQLGVQHALCLDYGDGRLQASDPQMLTAELTRIIRTFRPDVVITFGPDGAYGHPDHVAISEITTRAFALAGDSRQFLEQIEAGLALHTPARLYYSYFPRSQRLLSERLVQWLITHNERFHGSVNFAHALLLFSEEATMLGYSNDYFEVVWFPTGFYMAEQGEPATKLYLLLSGQAEIIHENDDGTLHTLAALAGGDFFGQEALANQQPHPDHVVATKDVTCLVFSPEKPSNFAGRGARAQFSDGADNSGDAQPIYGKATTCLDVSAYVPQKMAAMAAHRTQFSVEADMFPGEMLRDLFGKEYFTRVRPLPDLESNLFTMSDVLHGRLSTRRTELPSKG